LVSDALNEYGQRAIRDHLSNLIDVAPGRSPRIFLQRGRAHRDIVLPEGAPKLVAALRDRGYTCHPLPMTEFLKAGGACKS